MTLSIRTTPAEQDAAAVAVAADANVDADAGVEADANAEARGMLRGLIGVALFSLTLPCTRMAVAEIDPLLLTLGRSLGAALLAACWLGWTRARLPARAALPRLALVAGGCVVGFPLLASFAMRTLPAAHGAVLVGVLPLSTALYAAVRGHERPSRAFWLVALLGAGLVVAFALVEGGGGLQAADLLMFGAAAAAAAVGYAEGGRLARAMDGMAVNGWALLLAAPPLTVLLTVQLGPGMLYDPAEVAGLAGAAVLLGEAITPVHCAFALAVIGVVALGRRTRITS